MTEAQQYIKAVEFANQQMKGMESIVSNSITSALANQYGNYHSTARTHGSELWINPLMSIYWCFDLRTVVKHLKYYDYVKNVQTIGEFNGKLAQYRSQVKDFKKKKQIPI